MNCSSLSHPLAALRSDFDRQMGLRPRTSSHRLSILESDESVVVSLDVPGVSESDVSATIHDGHLLIEGERA